MHIHLEREIVDTSLIIFYDHISPFNVAYCSGMVELDYRNSCHTTVSNSGITLHAFQPYLKELTIYQFTLFASDYKSKFMFPETLFFLCKMNVIEAATQKCS